MIHNLNVGKFQIDCKKIDLQVSDENRIQNIGFVSLCMGKFGKRFCYFVADLFI